MKSKLAMSALGVLAVAGCVLLAPSEQTLGHGIRAVYIHVAWTWAGLALAATFVFTALAAAIAGVTRFERPPYRAYGFAFAYLLLGLLSSFVAAYLNWGMVVWEEPRTMALIRVLVALGFAWPVAWILRSHPRLRLAALATVIAVSVGWLYIVPRVLHPEAPVGESDSYMMKSVFYGLTVVWLAMAALWIFPARRDEGRPSKGSPSPLAHP